MQEQFKLLEPNKNGYISLQNLKTVSLFTYSSFQKLIFAHFWTFVFVMVLSKYCIRCRPWWKAPLKLWRTPGLSILSMWYVLLRNFYEINITFYISDVIYSFIILFIQVSSLQYRKLDFNEFAAAAVSVYQMEGLETWEHHARTAFDIFDQDNNRPIMIEELASVWSILWYSIKGRVTVRDIQSLETFTSIYQLRAAQIWHC